MTSQKKEIFLVFFSKKYSNLLHYSNSYVIVKEVSVKNDSWRKVFPFLCQQFENRRGPFFSKKIVPMMKKMKEHQIMQMSRDNNQTRYSGAKKP